MNILDREEAVELAVLINDIQEADEKTMYKGQDRCAYYTFVDEIYKNGFKIIKEGE